MLSKYWTFLYFWPLFTFKERSNILIFISQNEKQKQPQKKKEKGGKRKRKNTFFQSINATGKLHFSAPNSEIQKTLSSGNEKRFSYPDIILFFLILTKEDDHLSTVIFSLFKYLSQKIFSFEQKDE